MGISARQGAHHVAQRLTSSVFPDSAPSVVGFPSGPLKASAASDCGGSAGSIAATSPVALSASAFATLTFAAQASPAGAAAVVAAGSGALLPE